MTATLLSRLQEHDRALFSRCALGQSASGSARWFWTSLTHLGGASCTIAAAVLPLWLGGNVAHAARQALGTLVLSHLAVQLVKRTVGRPRPSCLDTGISVIPDPDRFSFPSGHSAAAMSVAFAYAMAYPHLAAPLLITAMLVGLSRVFLGVHYPGDVLVGQVLALVTGVAVANW